VGNHFICAKKIFARDKWLKKISVGFAEAKSTKNPYMGVFGCFWHPRHVVHCRTQKIGKPVFGCHM